MSMATQFRAIWDWRSENIFDIQDISPQFSMHVGLISFSFAMSLKKRFDKIRHCFVFQIQFWNQFKFRPVMPIKLICILWKAVWTYQRYCLAFAIHTFSQLSQVNSHARHQWSDDLSLIVQIVQSRSSLILKIFDHTIMLNSSPVTNRRMFDAKLIKITGVNFKSGIKSR